jgi:hypothetical protein
MKDRAKTPASTKTLPPQLPPAHPSRFARLIAWLRAWLRSRTGRIVVPVVALLLGILLGIVVILLIGISGEGQRVATSTAGQGDIIIEADRAYLSNIVIQNLRRAGMPGTIQNVVVTLAQGDQFTIDGDDAFSLLGIGVSKHFTLVVQPYIRSCFLQVHVVSANLSGIPVTGFVEAFESNINEQLQQKPSGLPTGFQYCATNVRTQPDGLFVTYSATPVAVRGTLSKQAW